MARPDQPSTTEPGATSEATPSRSRVVWIVAGVLAAIALVVGVALYVNRDTPAAVDTQAAIDATAPAQDAADDQPAEDDAADDADADADADAPADAPGGDPADPSGTWTVDQEIVAFDLDAGTGSFLGFRIDEELSTVGATEAIGRTPEVEGSVVIDGTQVTSTEITGDLTVLVTDISQRDGRTRSALDTGSFPTTTFALTDPIELGAIPPVGEVVAVTGVGELTLRGVTQPVEADLEAALIDGDTLLITGSFPLLLADHGITAPSAPIVVSVADDATVEWQLYLRRG